MDQRGAAAPPRPPAKVPGGAARAPPPRPLVTLQQPRPDSERRLNTYVDAPPGRPAAAAPPRPAPVHEPHHPGRPKRPQPPLTQQPTKRQPPPECRQDSIICPRCRKCRCTECANPRPLPSTWLGDTCLCSAETAIDYTSCMCCAKALFYHCCDDGDGAACAADEPCSCSGPRCLPRWACLGALAVPLPCLLCYWPLRGVAAVCAGAYARTRAKGCRCKPPREPY